MSVVHWHPLAENVLVSGSSDATVRIWDVESEQDRGVLDCFGDQVFDFAFSPRGDLMATASKDKVCPCCCAVLASCLLALLLILLP